MVDLPGKLLEKVVMASLDHLQGTFREEGKVQFPPEGQEHHLSMRAGLPAHPRGDRRKELLPCRQVIVMAG